MRLQCKCEGRAFQTRRDFQSSCRSLKNICIALYAVDLRSISVPLGANSARLSVDISSTSVSLGALVPLSLTTAKFVITFLYEVLNFFFV